MAASTLVIGYGNTLRGDDALGPAVVSLLAGRVDLARVELIAAPMLTPEMAVAVANAELVIFIDAARDGPVDRVICRRLGGRPAASSFGHHFDAAAVVDLARQLYGRAAESYLVTYRGHTFELREGLSPAVQAALEQVMARTLERISPTAAAASPDASLCADLTCSNKRRSACELNRIGPGLMDPEEMNLREQK